jgi:hypothetical protein
MEQSNDTIKIGDSGSIFEGTREQFHAIHGYSTDQEIITYCEGEKYSLSITHRYFDTASELYLADAAVACAHSELPSPTQSSDAQVAELAELAELAKSQLAV